MNLLWQKAQEFKKVHDFDNLSATCNQIIRLQPNFLTVWEFQAHNLAYNVSVEFDDYRYRYSWVKKGIDFLVKGNEYNRAEPRLLYYVGWFVGQKIGVADEHVQFRRMFRTDEEFHERMAEHVEGMNLPLVNGPDGFPDNWLVARLWYEKANSTVDDLGKQIKKTSPLVFFQQAAKSRINFADAIGSEGVFGEAARTAWQQAGDDWQEFGNRPIPSSWGVPVVLYEAESLSTQIRQLRSELEELAQLRERLEAERREALSDVERRAWESAEVERTKWGTSEWRRWEQAREKMTVTDLDVANAAAADDLTPARSLAKRISSLEEQLSRCDRYRSIVNYVYWRERCRVEQTELATEAREYLFDAEDARKKTDLDRARKSYEEAWSRWAQVFEKYPGVKVDISARDLEEGLKGYEWTLLQLGESGLPTDFPLKWVLDPNVPTTGPYSDASSDQIRQAEEEAKAKEAKAEDAKEEDGKPEENQKEENKSDEPANETPQAAPIEPAKGNEPAPAGEPAGETPGEPKPTPADQPPAPKPQGDG